MRGFEEGIVTAHVLPGVRVAVTDEHHARMMGAKMVADHHVQERIEGIGAFEPTWSIELVQQNAVRAPVVRINQGRTRAD